MPPKDTSLNDLKLDIAVSTNGRHTSLWKNEQWAWARLLERLRVPQVTHETYADYLKMPKPRQDEIKDVGGFVGGYLQGGRRKAGTVLHRQLVCLDEDQGAPDTWGDVTLLYDFTMAMYTTHKHSPDAPRRRFVIPLDRTVDASEYQAIARRLAADEFGNVDLFDHTTFQPERLMYWPSVSKDGVFDYQTQDGPVICADAVLARYVDWRDTSAWPISARERDVVLRGIRKQGDPLEKPGVVGAFCRSYDIHSAIETFLADRYTATDHDDRYTFTEGSTAGGLVVYEDKFAYSHHATDPAGQTLCNAFDLVRLHLFGLKDEDVKPGTPGNKMPSYGAMLDFASSQKTVRILLQRERQEQAQTDFAAVDAAVAEVIEDDSWKGDLDVDRRGNNLSTEKNYELILNNDTRFKGRFRWDDCLRRIMVTSHLPWRKLTPNTCTLSDWDGIEIVKVLGRDYGINVEKKIEAEIKSTAFRNRFNSLQDYLNSLIWDGEERLDTLLVDYQGAKDTPYVRMVTSKALISAIARAMEPGCKVDTVLTMVSKEGNYKSTLLNKLGGAWFSDSFSFGLLKHEKVAEERLQGFWIVEIPEMTGMGKAEIEHVKSFLSRRVDNYRVIFEKHLTAFPRNCVFFGTTNNVDFLRGVTGNRRFWPVDVGEQKAAKNVATEFTEAEVGQVWAEALERYSKGETWWLNEEENKLAIEQQLAHTETDDRVGVIEQYLDRLLPADWESRDLWKRREFLRDDAEEINPEGTVVRDVVCVAEIWCELFGGKIEQMNAFNTKDLHAIMTRISGWERAKSKRAFRLYGKQNAYVRVKKMEPQGGTASKNERFQRFQGN